MRLSLPCHLWIGLCLLACGGGDSDDGLVEPVSLQVGGTWSETAEVVSDPCDLIDRLDVLARNVRLSQVGIQLTLIHEGAELGIGSLTPSTGDFVLSGAYVVDNLGVRFTRRGNFSSPTRFTATSDILVEGGFFTCEIRTEDEGVR